MSSNIYNEGRVVGYSAYEVYVRHALSVDPTTQPASELEWLSSSIASGSSLLLRIPAEAQGVSGHHIVELILPEDSELGEDSALGAANTIVGSLFLGRATWIDDTPDQDGLYPISWAKNVTSYGPLLTNNSLYPTEGNHEETDVIQPKTSSFALNNTYQKQLLEYMKVVDGIVAQPGKWSKTSSQPAKDLSPNLAGRPTVRILLSDRITQEFYVLLTGFTLRTVLKGVSGLDGSTDPNSNMYANGGFLGPAVYPWANKIVFSVPPAYINYFLDKRYTRTINSVSASVNRPAVIDMETTDPATYYNTNYTTIPISYSISEVNNVTGDAVLTVYQRNTILPPAIYGTKVDSTGTNMLYPLDTVAPGTVKIFEGSNSQAEAQAVNNIDGNIGMYRDNNYILHQTLNSSNDTYPVADEYVDTIGLPGSQSRTGYTLEIETGNKSKTTISLQNSSGHALNLVGAENSSSTPINPSSSISTPVAITTPESYCGTLHWNDLLYALAHNKSIDLFNNDYFLKCIQSRLFPGFGISIQKTTKTIGGQQVTGLEIINDKPDISDGVGYTTLTQGTHFASVGYNGFVTDINTRNPALVVQILPNGVTRDYEYNGTTVKIPQRISIKINAGASGATLKKYPFKVSSDDHIDDPNKYSELTSKPAGWERPEVYTQYYSHVNNEQAPYIRLTPSATPPAWPQESIDPKYYYRIHSSYDIYHRGFYVGEESSYGKMLWISEQEQPAGWDKPEIYKQYWYKTGTGEYNPCTDTSHVWEPDNIYRMVYDYPPGFQFYHGDEYKARSTPGNYSWLFGVRFLKTGGDVQLIDGTTINLAAITSAIEDGTYKFQSTSHGSSGIWNIGVDKKAEPPASYTGINASPRASWGALTNVLPGFVCYKNSSGHNVPAYFYHAEDLVETESYNKDRDKGYINPTDDDTLKSHIIAAPASYEDGYNTQFSAYDAATQQVINEHVLETGDAAISAINGQRLWSDHLNVGVTCMFYTD